MNIVNTWTATIYVGLYNRDKKITHTVAEAREIIQKYVDELGLCVSVTETEFIYTKGNEPGLIVGLINYPRFPSNKVEINKKAVALAEKLRIGLEQYRVSIVTPESTILLGEEDNKVV